MSGIIYIQSYHSPCGDLILGAMDGKLCLADWCVEKHRVKVDSRLKRFLHAQYVFAPSETTLLAARQLDEYFLKQRQTFSVPLLFVGTDFQKQVWQSLLTIPYGLTVSYQTLATQIGSPSAVRAVANANAANAISIFAPCHRVVGTNGTLAGYSGGLATKQYLLNLEQNSRSLL